MSRRVRDAEVPGDGEGGETRSESVELDLAGTPKQVFLAIGEVVERSGCALEVVQSARPPDRPCRERGGLTSWRAPGGRREPPVFPGEFGPGTGIQPGRSVYGAVVAALARKIEAACVRLKIQRAEDRARDVATILPRRVGG